MRRVLTAATLGLAFVSASACTQTPAAGPSNPPVAAATTAAAATTGPAVDKATACVALTKASQQFRFKMLEALKTSLAALTDESKAQTASTQLLTALTDLRTAYGDNASVSDADLKAAIEADIKLLDPAIAAVAAAGADTDKIDAILDTPGLDEAGTTVDKLCKA